MSTQFDKLKEIFLVAVEKESPAERAAVLGETAVAVYGLGVDPSARPR